MGQSGLRGNKGKTMQASTCLGLFLPPLTSRLSSGRENARGTSDEARIYGQSQIRPSTRIFSISHRKGYWRRGAARQAIQVHLTAVRRGGVGLPFPSQPCVCAVFAIFTC